MGCDIHPYLEYENFYGYVSWKVILNRNYDMFALMADVRNRPDPLDPVALPKGLPQNASCWVYERGYSTDMHSHSWLSLAEMEEVLRRYVALGKTVADDYRAVVAAMRELGPTARLVFWFDN